MREATPNEARILLVGRSGEVMDIVLRELAEMGIAAQGTTEPECAAEAFDAKAFDLIVFGGGLSGQVNGQLRAAFAAQRPGIRFLDANAPRAAWQIAETLAGRTGAPEVDLDAYFARIGYSGPRTPTLDTLRMLHQLHPAAIAFEAIDVLLGKGIDIAPPAVDAKLIHAGRGGYCFEQNGLFKRVLTALGFQVEILLGRVRWGRSAGSPPRPRTHMVLQVTVDGEAWLADVGFGACVPTAPLRIGTTQPQPTQHEDFRVVPFGAPLLVEARIGDAWMPVYELPREPQLDADCETSNWFASTHPGSPFRSSLIAARVTPEARYALLNGRLTVRRPGGEPERQYLDATGIEAALGEVFGLPVAPEWRGIIEQAAAATAAEGG